ncbi:MAG: BlaI/MecI/CopY family transcriptional regulator [Acetatifactor sp.]|nr:BlaI/MecI/CopY family transcriptional regulator [Acetatifactor sp.]
MKSKYSVSEAEWEVLKALWKLDEKVTQTQLLEQCQKEGKQWKRQTLNTFLFRLEEKALVKREKGLVWAVYGEEEFSYLLMKEGIERLYQGKFSRFVAAFSQRNAIDQEDEQELLEIIRKSSTEGDSL